MRIALIAGGLFVLLGLSIVLDAGFHIKLPLFRIGLGLFIVYLGVRVLVGTRPRELGLPNSSVVMDAQRFAPSVLGSDHAKYDVIFGRGVVDLRELATPDRDVTVEVNAIFGNAVVYVAPEQNLVVEASSVFGQARVPDRQSVAFGSLKYAPRAAKPGPVIHLKVSAVFGGVEVDEAQRGATDLTELHGPTPHAT